MRLEATHLDRTLSGEIRKAATSGEGSLRGLLERKTFAGSADFC